MKKTLGFLVAFVLLFAFSCPARANEANTAKYVFMFIGDGMGAPQITAAEYFKGAAENPESVFPVPSRLNFSQFSVTGIMTTYDSTSFCPDSASTATSMASGRKTLSGVINYNEELTEPFNIITEYAKASGKKIGVVTSVSLDHATPAAYYAKSPSRGNYYDIALQAAENGLLDFLGGGTFIQQTGSDGSLENVFDIAAKNSINIVTTNDGIRELSPESGRVIASVEDLADSGSMNYEIDRLHKMANGEDSLSLADITRAAIRVIDNDNGFFLMVEGGKVDWTCHGNDATTSIYDTLAFADAVQVAIDFAQNKPDETLIIVTGDHETGGLTIGFAATEYDTHFAYLLNQNISFTQFTNKVAAMRESNTSFDDAMAMVEECFGLTTTPEQDLSLTQEELSKLRTAFDLSMISADKRELEESDALAYGGYEPFTMAITHILNNKAGIAFSSYSHTGLQMPVYAMGASAEKFTGSYDNTEIFLKTMEAMGISQDETIAQEEASNSNLDFQGKIHVVSRESGSGTRSAFIEILGIEIKNDDGAKKDRTSKDAVIADATGAVLLNIEQPTHMR